MSELKDNAGSNNGALVAATLAMTIVFAVAGVFLGAMLARAPQAAKPSDAAIKEAPADDSQHGASTQAHGATPRTSVRKAEKTVLKELAPIVTNLGDGNSSWIRLQVAIVYDPDALTHPEILISELTADIVAYLRSLSLRAIEGSSGLRRLNEELSERASIRSESVVQEIIIQSLVVQ